MFSASVVITTKNRKEELLKAVESSMAQRALLEVIIIDDGSTDGTAEELHKKFSVFSFQSPEEQPATTDSRLAIVPMAPLPATSYSSPVTTGGPVLRLIRHEVSAGYIIRRNEGARVARGDVIFSLDDDAVFSSPFVVEQTLRDFSHPQVGAVAIPYIEPHKANTEMQRAPTREDVWVTASYIGTAHAVRRDVFLALGGYREHLVHQGEEGDFCIRMLAAKPPMVESGKRKAEILKADLTTIECQGRREKEQLKVGPKGEGVETSESKDTENTTRQLGGCSVDCRRLPEGQDERERASQRSKEAGLRPGSQAGAAFSNPFPSEFARDSENTSLTSSASIPASALDSGHWSLDSAPPATSHSPLATPLRAVPGFFVRLGNSDPIIHNESPKRDYSRMDYYGRHNDVLFHWQNTPMPELLWQLPMTIFGGLLCAYRVKRWRKMLEGMMAGFLAIAGGLSREPIARKYASQFKYLKNNGPVMLFE